MAELNKRIADALSEAGVSPEETSALSDEALLKIPGIGPPSLEELRTVYPPAEPEAAADDDESPDAEDPEGTDEPEDEEDGDGADDTQPSDEAPDDDPDDDEPGEQAPEPEAPGPPEGCNCPENEQPWKVTRYVVIDRIPFHRCDGCGALREP